LSVLIWHLFAHKGRINLSKIDTNREELLNTILLLLSCILECFRDVKRKTKVIFFFWKSFFAFFFWGIFKGIPLEMEKNEKIMKIVFSNCLLNVIKWWIFVLFSRHWNYKYFKHISKEILMNFLQKSTFVDFGQFL
jgi:hypothetical protein